MPEYNQICTVDENVKLIKLNQVILQSAESKKKLPRPRPQQVDNPWYDEECRRTKTALVNSYTLLLETDDENDPVVQRFHFNRKIYKKLLKQKKNRYIKHRTTQLMKDRKTNSRTVLEEDLMEKQI